MSEKKRKRPAPSVMEARAETSLGHPPAIEPPSVGKSRRPWWLVIVLFQVLAVLLWLSNAFFSGIDNSIVLPIRIALVGLGNLPGINQPVERLEFDLPVRLAVNGPNGSTVIDPLHAQNGVEVAIGGKKFSFSREEFFQQWQVTQAKNTVNEDTYHVVAPPAISAEHSLLPMYWSRINWGGDGRLLYYSFPENIFILLEAGMAIVLLLRLPALRGVERWALGGLSAEHDIPAADVRARLGEMALAQPHGCDLCAGHGDHRIQSAVPLYAGRRVGECPAGGAEWLPQRFFRHAARMEPLPIHGHSLVEPGVLLDVVSAHVSHVCHCPIPLGQRVFDHGGECRRASFRGLFRHVLGGAKAGHPPLALGRGQSLFRALRLLADHRARLVEHDPRRGVDAAVGRVGDRIGLAARWAGGGWPAPWP